MHYREVWKRTYSSSAEFRSRTELTILVGSKDRIESTDLPEYGAIDQKVASWYVRHVSLFVVVEPLMPNPGGPTRFRRESIWRSDNDPGTVRQNLGCRLEPI